jgi:acyl carrier protein
MKSRADIAALILSIVTEMGDELDCEPLKHPDEQTRLMGDKSALDSIGLVSLIAEVEAQVSEATAQDIVLADERAMSLSRSPFRRVGTLIDHTMNCLQSDA